MLIKSLISLVESQKGAIITIQRCSVENQKGAIAVYKVYGVSALLHGSQRKMFE